MFKLDQKGISLPIVLGAAALILANTYYFLSVNKSANDRNKQTTVQVTDQSESSRVTSFLSDFNVCANDASKKPATPSPLLRGNFYNQNITALSDSVNGISASLKKLRDPNDATSGIDFLVVGGLYSKGTHQVKKYYFQRDTNAAMNTLSRDMLKYNFVIEYDIVSAHEQSKQNIFSKKTSLVKIPMFVQLDGAGLVKTCFARPALTPSSGPEIYNNVNSVQFLDDAVGQACRQPIDPPLVAGNPTLATSKYLDTATGTVNNCFEQINDPYDAAALPAQHPSTPPASATLPFAFNGVSARVDGINKGQQEFSVAAFGAQAPHPETKTNFTCNIIPTVPLNEFVTQIVNSDVTCSVAHNGGCAAGTMMLKNGATVTCAPACSNTQFFNSISGFNTTCYKRVQPCDPGEYVYRIFANGDIDCEPIKFKNIYCPANQYATHIDTTTADVLHCAAYTRARDCGVNPNSFANDLRVAPPGIGCKTFTF